MEAKRLFDFVFATLGLAIFAPLMLVSAIAVRAESSGPAIFRQTRVGLRGRHFRILKFRTMVLNADKIGAQITSGSDPRITRVGGLLRRYKIDELPQLINVVLGEMSLVGPRPEVPQYVEHYPQDARREVLSVRPGLTDLASIDFFDEAAVLNGEPDHTVAYVEKILPAKLESQRKYVRERSLIYDLRIIFRTLVRVVSR
jgi:lipopolysaccharide/colanic/teichoic acid biosynthesis glycosyltransferase